MIESSGAEIGVIQAENLKARLSCMYLLDVFYELLRRGLRCGRDRQMSTIESDEIAA